MQTARACAADTYKIMSSPKRGGLLKKSDPGELKEHKEITSLFRGADISRVLEALGVCETEAGVFADRSRGVAKQAYLDGPSQVVVTSRLKRWSNLKLWAKVILGRESVGDLVTPLAHTSCAAARVRVKHNVLAFYPQNQMICKYWLASGARPVTALQTEATTLRSIHESGLFRVPRVIADNTNHELFKVPALWLQEVSGRTPTPPMHKRVALKLARLLISWYEHNKVEFTQASIFESPTHLSLEKYLAGYGWSVDEAEVIVAAEIALRKAGESIPISMIHGDASPGNVLLDDSGEITVIDWELSRRDLVAIDLASLSSIGGYEIRDLFEQWLLFYKREDMLSPDRQIDLIWIRSRLKLAGARNASPRAQGREDIDPQLVELKKELISKVKKLAGLF